MAELTVALSALGLVLLRRQRRMGKVRRNRTKWVKSWIQQRQPQGAYPDLCRELAVNEPADFRDFARMFPAQFQMLEESIRPIIQRKNTNYRDSISAAERLTVTLRFLATGESSQSLSYHFRMGVSTIRQFIPETCEVIYRVLKEKYLKCPDTALEWQRVAAGFLSRWNFPNCVGALDGKHVNMRPPPVSGATHHNYKPPFPLDVMALVDSDYRFLYVDVGSRGRLSDGGGPAGRTFAEALGNRTADIPAPAPLPGSDQLSPYCVVADEAFPLQQHLMTPYPQRGLSLARCVFNDRLSRAQRVAENAFGVLASRFRVLLTTVNFRDTAKVESIVLACCALHNALSAECCEAYRADIVDREGPDDTILPGRWREDPGLQRAPLPRTTAAAGDDDVAAGAEQTRNELCLYFMSDCGAVPRRGGDGSERSEGGPESDDAQPPPHGATGAESPACGRRTPCSEASGSGSSSEGTDHSQRRRARRKRKRGRDGAAADEEVVLMRTIGETLERLAPGGGGAPPPRQQESGDYISVYCKRIEHRLRSLPPHRLPELEFQMDSLLYRFSQNQIQEPDRKDFSPQATDRKDPTPPVTD